MRSILEFPVKHLDGNLVFGRDGTVWAYYGIEGFGYDFREDEEKMWPFQNQLSFLRNNEHDLHFLVVPNPTDVTEVCEETIRRIAKDHYALRDYGIEFLRQQKQAVSQQRSRIESNEYRAYLGIQLDPKRNQYREGNMGTNLISSLREMIEGFKTPVYRAAGLEPYDIPTTDIAAYREQADSLLDTVRGGFSCAARKLTAVETVYLIEKVFSVANNDVKMRESFSAGIEVKGEDEKGQVHRAIRPNDEAFFDLQNANVDEVGPKTLLLSKIIDNEVQKTYVQYLVCHDMDAVNYHPGFEWLYHIQSVLPFPVSISVRAHHQTNARMLKRLSDVRLEFQDQREEAQKGGTNVDLSVSESESGAIQMESYFRSSGKPGYSCSFVFRVNAPDEATLKSRVDRLRNELMKFGIRIVSPYGEQINLLMETIPGSKPYNQDYRIEVEPGVLAGMMFGATTNIGDGQGFYIGYTRNLKRPVFIRPDLAAKAFDSVKNVIDSISIMVAGATGKGKSFLMNLLVYLSVLTGSMALVIDPKGDRKKWVNGLPFIPKEHVSVWTLGSSEADAGCLDPFRTSVNLEEAKDIAMDILAYLAGVDIEDHQYTILSEAIEAASEEKDPCIGAVINYVRDLYDNKPENMSETRHEEVERLKSTLETLGRNQLARLLFGEPGQDYRVLRVEKPLQVIMVQNLNLPDEKVKQYRISHKISEAILISLAAFTKQYMFNQDRHRHKIILQDEAESIDRSPVGSELLNFVVRKGRYYNTTLLKGTQNASDYKEEVANMGMKFSFGLRKTSEAEKMLDYFNLPRTENNVETLKNLRRGEALFQDIYGRSAVIRIDPVFRDLLDAFDSSTATKEEREREKKNHAS
ncbi:AAA domain-containing protein [Planifilum fimeticola]|uniref:AAA domain-containing protein n=1 Tax=Planifilum fimeticola TaxID=201975 RepID=A0A2T0LFE7_9BACL|nr:ATP-binding protein [Planifilum fimeticola]PRX40916.1 AAA domain-containing protein [Planifilum fimeticola]